MSNPARPGDAPFDPRLLNGSIPPSRGPVAGAQLVRHSASAPAAAEPRATAPAGDGGEYTFDYVDSDIREIVRVILGSINGTSVSGRSYSLNAAVVMVQRKLAALAADYVVRTDLALADPDRALLHGVTGTEDPRLDEAALRSTIVALVRRLYGQRVDASSAEVEVWLRLYRALWEDQTQGGTNAGQVPGTQGQQAWRGLLVAMLRSPRLLLY